MFTTTRLQAVTYLLGVCLFSISFLVFLNSSISFVITDLIKQKEGVGNAVGTLGFADELLALIACPLWGVISDRIGVRSVDTTLPIGLEPTQDLLGLRNRLCHSQPCLALASPVKECVPRFAAFKAFFQSWRLSNVNNGHGNVTFNDSSSFRPEFSIQRTSAFQ